MIPIVRTVARLVGPGLVRIGSLGIGLIGLGLLASCSGDDGPGPGTPLGQLTRNRRLWADAGLNRYDFRLERRCFCQPEYGMPLGIRVKDGAVVEVWRDPGHEYVDPFFGDTVESLFTRIENAITAGYETVDVRYNGTFGYPEEIALDKAEVVDEEFGASAELLCRETRDDPGPLCDCAPGEGGFLFDLTLRGRDGALHSRGCLGLTFTPTSRAGYREAVGGRRCLTTLCGADLPDVIGGDFSVAGLVDTLGNLSLDISRGQSSENITLVARLEGERGGRVDFSGDWNYRFKGSITNTGPFTAVLHAPAGSRQLDGVWAP